MKTLIVIGASGERCPTEVAEAIRNALHSRWPDGVRYVDNREQAFDLLEEIPESVLAYAPGCFAEAVGGKLLSPKVWTGEPQIVLTTSGDPASWHGTDDPRQFLEAAAAVLDVHLTLNVESEIALDVLTQTLGVSEAVGF